MKRIFLRLKQPLRNERGEITFFACFFVVGIVMLISFLLLYASIRITCINIRNGAKMELNNLSGTIYADTYRSQRETNFEEYLNTLYSSNDYTDMLEATVAGGLDSKIPLSTEDYKVSDISLEFNVEDGRVEYIFYCDVEFYVWMFGHSYPASISQIHIAQIIYAVFQCSASAKIHADFFTLVSVLNIPDEAQISIRDLFCVLGLHDAVIDPEDPGAKLDFLLRRAEWVDQFTNGLIQLFRRRGAF